MSAEVRVAAVVLAAGRGTRMPAGDKLLLPVDGRPLLLHAVDAALGSRARPVLVVVGHHAARLTPLLAGRPVTIVDNPAHAGGLSTSLRAGVAALPADSDGALFLLADMPRVGAALLDRLITAFAADARRPVCVPRWAGRRGNPVLWPARLFPALAALHGDVGGRTLLGRHAEEVVPVEVNDDGILVDVDRPEDLARLSIAAAGPRP